MRKLFIGLALLNSVSVFAECTGQQAYKRAKRITDFILREHKIDNSRCWYASQGSETPQTTYREAFQCDLATEKKVAVVIKIDGLTCDALETKLIMNPEW